MATGKKMDLPVSVQRDEVVIEDTWVAMGIEELHEHNRYGLIFLKHTRCRRHSRSHRNPLREGFQVTDVQAVRR